MKKLRVGTRGSLLATTQTGFVVQAIQEANPGLEIETVIIKTTGDANQKLPLSAFGTQGVFVKELEDALAADKIDVAVHSLKDVPHALPATMEIAAYFKREDPRDVFISKYQSWKELPEKAVVGTGSPRRRLQLSLLRPDLQFVELRGNIDTRLAKADTGEMDAIVLAAAGLHRLGLVERTSKPFSTEEMLPAIAQGVVAMETRLADSVVQEIIRKVEPASSRIEAEVERYFMQAIGGGCKVPMAGLAQQKEESIFFEALLGEEGKDCLRMEVELKSQDWKAELDEFVVYFAQESKAKGLTLPSELPDHALLRDS